MAGPDKITLRRFGSSLLPWLAAAGAFCLLLLGERSRAAEAELEIGASESEIFIQPDFTGTSIVIFGAIDRPRLPAPRAAPYDIAIAVRGPSVPKTVWKKDRVAGVWANDEGITFPEAPSFYLVLSTSPLEDIVPEWEREQYRLGLDALTPEASITSRQVYTKEELKPFQEALIRLNQERGHYKQKASGVEFLGERLFRAKAEIPASVPMGLYSVSVYLIRDSKVVSRSTAFIRLQKAGIERFLSAAAQEQPLLYGFGAVFVAVAIGGLASVAFRR